MTSPPVCSLSRLLCSAQRTKTLEHSSTCFLKPFDLDYMSGLFFWGCPPAKSSAKKVSKRRGSFSCLCAFRTSPRPSHRLHHQNPTAERTMSFPPFLKPTSHEKPSSVFQTSCSPTSACARCTSTHRCHVFLIPSTPSIPRPLFQKCNLNRHMSSHPSPP